MNHTNKPTMTNKKDTQTQQQPNQTTDWEAAEATADALFGKRKRIKKVTHVAPGEVELG